MHKNDIRLHLQCYFAVFLTYTQNRMSDVLANDRWETSFLATSTVAEQDGSSGSNRNSGYGKTVMVTSNSREIFGGNRYEYGGRSENKY